MKEMKKIIYFGDQADVLEFIQKYYSKRVDLFRVYEVKQVFSFEDLAASVDETLSLLVMDFCENDSPSFLGMCLNMLKKGLGNFTIPTMGVFKSKEQLISLENLWGMGINYFYIKGADLMQAFNSMSYICFEDETFCGNYAFVKGFKAPTLLNGIGLISNFNRHSLTVDKDLRGVGEGVEMRTNLFKDFTITRFLQEESFEKGFKYETLFSELLQIEYSSGWDVGENLMFEDTFTSWIEMNRESFIAKKATVFIYTENLEKVPRFVALLEKYPALDIHFRKDFEGEKKEILKYRPDLILFSMDTENSFVQLDALVEGLSADERLANTILYLFKHPSKSVALRKLYQKENILASARELEPAFMEKLLERMDRVKKEKKGSFQFDYLDPRAMTLLPFDTDITSLTENEITFTTKTEIPYYTLLFLEKPFPMFLVTIPSLKRLTQNGKENHYMAFLCGLDFHEQDYLRRYVNHVVHEGMKSLDYIDFEQDFKAASAQKKQEDSPDIKNKEVEDNEKEDMPKGKRLSSSKRPKTQNKVSKL